MHDLPQSFPISVAKALSVQNATRNAFSYRVWRPPDASDKTPYGRISEVIGSNIRQAILRNRNRGMSLGEVAKLHRVSRTSIARTLKDVVPKGSRRYHFNSMKTGSQKRPPEPYRKVWLLILLPNVVGIHARTYLYG